MHLGALETRRGRGRLANEEERNERPKDVTKGEKTQEGSGNGRTNRVELSRFRLVFGNFWLERGYMKRRERGYAHAHFPLRMDE